MLFLNQQTSGECANKGGGSLVAELLGLSADQKLELGQAVLRAVLQKEEALRAAITKQGDYTKSFSGTKQDTQVRIIGAFRMDDFQLIAEAPRW